MTSLTKISQCCRTNSTLAASICSPAYDAISVEFGVSPAVALLPLSFYNLGIAFGPIVSSPLSETFGRKAVSSYHTYFRAIPPRVRPLSEPGSPDNLQVLCRDVCESRCWSCFLRRFLTWQLWLTEEFLWQCTILFPLSLLCLGLSSILRVMRISN
jgi:MFS family permease